MMNYLLPNNGPQLREYQLEASEAVFNFYSQPRKLDENGIPIRRNALVCLPTGTGKSLVIADVIRKAFGMVPQTRVTMATHVKELIKQNAHKLQEAWPLAPLGIYSAGLDARDNIQPVIYGGIRSMVGKYPMFGFRDFLLIDEAHLLSPNSDTSYMTFINELMYGPDFDGKLTRQVFERAVANPNCNPYLKVIGFTATAYRLGLGLMTNGPIFTDIVYDLCNIDGFLRLLANGYLCPLISHSKDKAGKALVELDTSGVGLGSDGDFAQGALQAAVDKSPITYAAIKQMVEEGQDRASWLIFASGIQHAENIGHMLDSFGISNVVVHSKSTGNDKKLEAWKRGEVRAAVNMNSLTTGIDHPPCDYIGVLRPTKSTGLWVQMLGRGTRPFDWHTLSAKDKEYYANFAGFTKSNCKVMDFARNTRTLGPINDPVIPRLKGSGPPGDSPVKICDCGVYNHASARYCIACGTEFPFSVNINKTASTDAVMKSDLPQIETLEVKYIVCGPHTSKKSGQSMIRVSIFCGLRTFYDHMNFESPIPFVRHKARNWFRQLYGEPAEGLTNEQALSLAKHFRNPARIRVWMNKNPSPEVQAYEF